MFSRSLFIIFLLACVCGLLAEEITTTELSPSEPAVSSDSEDHHTEAEAGNEPTSAPHEVSQPPDDQHHQTTAEHDSHDHHEPQEPQTHHEEPQEHHRQSTQPLHPPPDDHEDRQRASHYEHPEREHEQHTDQTQQQEEVTTEQPSALPPKVSIQSTFKFTSEERCFGFLHRLKAKGRNEHPDHPLTCREAFDGILCWRSADPGETLQQVCPEGPSNLKNYARRECVNGRWRDYGNVNDRLIVRGIRESDYSDCMQVPGFSKKHVPQPTSAELQGPGSATDYPYSTQQSTGHQDHIPVHPNYMEATTPLHESRPDFPPPPPWIIKDTNDCLEFLHKHNLDNTRGGTWCPGGSDGRMCWPATARGVSAKQPCYEIPANASTDTIIPLATRHCGIDGKWNQSKADGSIPETADADYGYVNYEQCDAIKAVMDAASSIQLNLEATTLTTTETEATKATESDIVLTAEPVTSAPVPSLALASIDNVKGPWLHRGSASECETFLKSAGQWDKEAGSCRGATDGTVCWPSTKKSSSAQVFCPPVAGLDSTKLATRECGANGEWTKSVGNYVDCLTAEMKNIVKNNYQLSSATTILPSMLFTIFALKLIL